MIIVFAAQCRCSLGIVWQTLQKPLEARSVETKIRWELPQDRSEVQAKLQNAGGHEVREWNFHVSQTPHVRDEPGCLDREDEFGGHLADPAAERLGTHQAIEGPIDLDGAKLVGGVFQFLLTLQPLR